MSILFELERMERLVQDIEKLRCSLSIPIRDYKMYEGKLQEGGKVQYGKLAGLSD